MVILLVAEKLDAGGVRRESSVILLAFVKGVVVGVEEKGGGAVVV